MFRLFQPVSVVMFGAQVSHAGSGLYARYGARRTRFDGAMDVLLRRAFNALPAAFARLCDVGNLGFAGWAVHSDNPFKLSRRS